jgi:uroporphyrinogen-III decarboxylase
MNKITDFAKHNAEVKAVWDAYYAGKPTRVPNTFGINARFVLLDEALNPEGITFEQYSNDPEIMLEVQIRYQEYVRFNVPQDAPMGLPEKWDVKVDFQNYFEAGFLGAEVYYPEGNCPVSLPMIAGDAKRLLLDKGLPEPSQSPLYQKNIRFYEYMVREREKGREYKGRPLGTITPAMSWTDGPLTLLMSIRGDEGLVDMYLDPGYFEEMMAFMVEFETKFSQATRKLAGLPLMPDRGDFADDSIELISSEDYRRFILKWHRKLLAGLSTCRKPGGMHICGDVQRHFPMLRDELNIHSFDTGFPIRWETLRGEVGEDVEIAGGPHIEVLRLGTPEAIRAETRRILRSGIMRGGRFIIHEANNLPPKVPIANLYAMYEATKEFGRY